MKIQSTPDWLGPVRPEQPQTASKPAQGEFGEILKTRLSQASAAASATAAGGALCIQFLPKDSLPIDSLTAKIEGFLDLMEEYHRQLADPRVSLKALDPLVGALERGRDGLTPVLESLPEDNGLTDILNRALVTTEMEIMRFRRGDYLPA